MHFSLPTQKNRAMPPPLNRHAVEVLIATQNAQIECEL